MKKLLRIHSVGGSYPSSNGRRGWRYSAGFNHAFIEGEDRPRYYPENMSWLDISEDLKSKGVDTGDFDRALEDWVKTGNVKVITK